MYVTKFNTILGNKIIYSNTYNAFLKVSVNYKIPDYEYSNSIVNKISEKEGRKIIIRKYSEKITDEVVFYNNMIFCFIIINSYRVLYNQLLQSEVEIYYTNFFINDNLINKFHKIDNGKVTDLNVKMENGEIKTCAVLNTYESFLDYTSIHSLGKYRNSNNPFFGDFLRPLKVNSIKQVMKDHQYGTLLKDSINSTQFTYIFFENVVIITSYAKCIKEIQEPLICPF